MISEAILRPAIASKGPVRTGCAHNSPPDSLQRGQNPSRLSRRPLTHAAIEYCNMSASGLNSPCSISSAITRSASALTFVVASSGVEPYTVPPASSGTSPIQRPSTSRSKRIVRCICVNRSTDLMLVRILAGQSAANSKPERTSANVCSAGACHRNAADGASIVPTIQAYLTFVQSLLDFLAVSASWREIDSVKLDGLPTIAAEQSQFHHKTINLPFRINKTPDPPARPLLR